MVRSAAAGKISYVEAFALSEDRAEALKLLIGSPSVENEKAVVADIRQSLCRNA